MLQASSIGFSPGLVSVLHVQQKAHTRSSISSRAFAGRRSRFSFTRLFSILISAKPKALLHRNCTCRALRDEKSEKPSERDAKVEGPSHAEITDLGWLPVFPHILVASIANLLFGYHIGIMNGPIIAVAQELGFEGEPLTEGLVVSIFVAAAFIGSLSTGILADKIGRKLTLQLNLIPLIFGMLLSGHANSVNEMIFGRFLVGLGIGANTVLVPIYISEVSPTNYRGSLGSICQLATCIGIIIALLLGIPCDSDPHWWRTMFYIGSVPGFAMMIGLLFAVESPRWLSKVGRVEDVKRIISELWSRSELKDALNDLQDMNGLSGNFEEVRWSELLTKQYYKAPAIGGTLFSLQQFAGINGVLYFSSLTFADVGINNSLAASVAVGIANFLGSIIALYLMDKTGRRRLLMGSYIGMATSMLLLAFILSAPVDKQIKNYLSVFGTLMYVCTFSLGAGPVTGLIIPELSPTRARAKTVSFSLCIHWVCNFIVGLLFLEFVQEFGLPVIYLSFGIVSVLAFMFTYYYVIETKGRSLEDIELLLNPDLKNGA